jgi:hypothetical protein
MEGLMCNRLNFLGRSLLVLGLWTLAGCGEDLSQVGGTHAGSSVPGNQGGNGHSPPIDLVGTPDLQVRSDMLGKQWLTKDETFAADECAAIEGGVSAGDHPVLRFTVGVANIGDADLYIGDPNAHFTPYGDPNGTSDGLFEFANCHHHFHFKHYVKYELISDAGQVWRAAKRGFCMLDTDPDPAWLGEPSRAKLFDNCGSWGVAGNQGISHGWSDTYRFDLPGQFFVLDGGDGQPVVPPGNYTLRITANPPFVAGPGEACPHLDAKGFCHTLPESNYDNNVAETTLAVTDHPGRTGLGPAAGQGPSNGPLP